MSVRYLERISATELVETLRSPTARRPLIIDVRDTDFVGGHIRSAVNLPEENFIEDDDVDALVEKYKDEDTIVFHCMMSQIRGPSCARRFLSRMAVVLENEDKKPNVRVLAGGYQHFSRIYKDDADLIEK
uniref:protein-tyrosine-phosphatase n=1 Tax=Globisporangium ultimum (strain ATCC 200006 / CBS 805.95 / DAOM BR144) TaxID=431595 RepID=K3WPS9_GLOUD